MNCLAVILRWKVVLAAVFAVFLADASATAAVLVVSDSHSLQSQARDGDVPEVIDSFEDLDTIAGQAAFSQLAVEGNSTTMADYTVINDADGLYLQVDYSMARAGTTQSMTQVIGGVNFTVTEPTPYSIEGFLSATTTEPATYNGYNLYARLLDSNGTLFENLQSAGNLSSLDLTTNEQVGNFSNSLVGSPTGMLQPGEDYFLEYYSQVLQFNTIRRSDTAYGTGYWKIQLGTTRIPEPATVGLVMLGIGLMFARRRRLA